MVPTVSSAYSAETAPRSIVADAKTARGGVGDHEIGHVVIPFF